MGKRKKPSFDPSRGVQGREVEIKLRVPDLAALRRKLKSLGARLVARVQERNTLYDTPRGQFAKRGQLLRLRLETPLGAGKPHAVLTYKGPTLRLASGPSARRAAPALTEDPSTSLRASPSPEDQGKPFGPPGRPQDRRYKVRDEAEVPVTDPQCVRAILEAIGLRPGFRYEKRRASYRLPGIKGLVVDLDETPIGVFVELEGPRRAIDRAAKLLGYRPADYITKSYRALYLDHLRQTGLPPGDMLFTPRKK